MSTDRELLVLAAKAAGYPESKIDERGWFYVCVYPGEPKEWELWDPLTNDGDALTQRRLSMKALKVTVFILLALLIVWPLQIIGYLWAFIHIGFKSGMDINYNHYELTMSAIDNVIENEPKASTN